MRINPQFIYGKDGLPVNVVISYEEWLELKQRIACDVPQSQIDESSRRLKEYYKNPESSIDAEAFLDLLEKEDNQ